MKIPIDNITDVEVISGTVKLKYKDGTKMTVNGDIHLISNYKNENNIPLNDHCS